MTLASIKDFILDILFPIYCLGCGREGEFLCDDCSATFDISTFRHCLCQEPARLFGRSRCSKCFHKRNLDGLYTALDYREPRVRRLIHLFKYEPYLKALSQPLADFILSHLALLKMEEGEQILERLNPSFLTAVPLSGRRQRQRGFNQSAELAKELAKKLSIPLLDGCLIKVKNTASQVELSEKERKENVKGAFLVKKSAGVKDQKIILIDDVYTTGSTMEECARVLKKAGAKQVWGIVVARG